MLDGCWWVVAFFVLHTVWTITAVVVALRSRRDAERALREVARLRALIARGAQGAQQEFSSIDADAPEGVAVESSAPQTPPRSPAPPPSPALPPPLPPLPPTSSPPPLPLLRPRRREADPSDFSARSPEIDAAIAGAAPPSASPSAAPSALPSAALIPTPTPTHSAAPIAASNAVERSLGERVYVWLGGCALALAGAFFVKYAADHGWLGRTARCWIGLAFAGGLVGLAERARRESVRTAQALAGAGIAVAYAVLYVAVERYALIGQGLGLGLLAALTAFAVVLSTRHGPFVATLGLLGGFGMPALLGGGEASAARLAFFAALQIGVQAAEARRRPMFALFALLASLGWGVAALQQRAFDAPLDVIALYALAIGATALAFARMRDDDGSPGAAERRETERLTRVLGTLGASILVAAAVQRGGYAPASWWYAAAATAGALVYARTRPGATYVAWIALVVPFFSFVDFAGSSRSEAAGLVAAGGVIVAGAGAALLAIRAATPSVFAFYSAVATAAFAVAAFAFDLPLPFGLSRLAWCLLLGAGHAAAAYAHLRRRTEEPRRAAAAPHVFAAAAAVVGAPGLLFDDEPVSATLCALAPVALFLARRLALPELRKVAAGVAVLGGALAFFRDQPAARQLRGVEPHWELWWATGLVPVAAFAVAAYLLRDDEARHPRRRFALAAARFAILGVGLAARRCCWEREPDLFAFTVRDAGVLGTAWFALAWVLARLAARLPELMPKTAGVGAALFGAAAVVLPHRFPLWALSPEGGLGASHAPGALILLYAAPAALCAALARRFARTPGFPVEGPQVAGLAAVAGGFAFLTTTIRRAFFGADAAAAPTSAAEAGVLVTVWLLAAAATALLVARRSRGISPVLPPVLVVAALAGAVFLHRRGASPFDPRADLGEIPFLNPLLSLYLAPTAAGVVLGRSLRAAGIAAAAVAVEALAALGGWLYLTASLRHAFVGADFGGPAPDDAELYAYSAAWIAYAILLLLVGVKTRHRTTRLASAAFMALAVGKVFLYDAAGLRDLWRVASFLGLGAVLLGLGYVYRRFVFPPSREPTP